MSKYVSEAIKTPPVSKKDKSESSSLIADGMSIRIPPVEYKAVCYATNTGISFGGRLSLYVQFRICGGEYDGVEVPMICTLPKGKLRQRFKLFVQWALVLGRAPYKGEKFKASVFKNKMYRILVRDTKCVFPNRKPKPKFLQYSVVDTIIETITGIPDAS